MRDASRGRPTATACAPGHQREFRRSGSDRLHGESRRPNVLTPADGAGGGPVEAIPLPENEAAAETMCGLHTESLGSRPERAGDVSEMPGHLLFGDPDETGELVGGVRARAEMVEECFADGHRALRRWALAARRGHVARILHLGPHPPPSGRSGYLTCSRGDPRRAHARSTRRHRGSRARWALNLPFCYDQPAGPVRNFDLETYAENRNGDT